MSVEEKIDQAKDIIKEGVDKVTDNKNVVLISVVSSVIAALVVVAVLSFFFGKKEKNFSGK
nr:hypothetical protein [uncultured Lachnoanaerobaculum sp.]